MKKQRKMELAETAARETEMEQLRIALSIASNELRKERTTLSPTYPTCLLNTAIFHL